MSTTILKRGTTDGAAGIALMDLAHPGRAPRLASDLAIDDPEAQHAPEVHSETRLEVVRLEGVVQAIEVHCACGEVTVVELDTSTATPNTSPSPDPVSAPNPDANSGATPSQGESDSPASVTEDPS
jgi:hypothetical protein